MRTIWRLLILVAGLGGTAMSIDSVWAQYLITGNDEKVSFDDITGKTITHPPGKDTVSIIDIANPIKPKIVSNLPLMNTITGPPVNLAITPNQHLALVANSLDWVKDGNGWKGVPDNEIYVIDLTTSGPGKDSCGIVTHLPRHRGDVSPRKCRIPGVQKTTPIPAIGGPGFLRWFSHLWGRALI